MLLRAIEEKRFPPMGSDKEVSSNFQLIAGTNRDLSAAVQDGRFRDDLHARLNLWTFELPSLKDRSKDIEPNLDFELARFAANGGERVQFNREARARYLQFAIADEALWPGNLRDLGASITRMATLAESERLTVSVVDDELRRLRHLWKNATAKDRTVTAVDVDLGILLGAGHAQLDRFDMAQLIDVARVCRSSQTASAAGRTLFQASRAAKTSTNDADRLRKYLARFDLTFADVWV